MDLFDCVTTEISLSGNGSATGNVAYLWTTTNGVIVSGASTLNPSISAPGTYTILVTDNITGCTNTASVTVDADMDVPQLTVSSTQPTCFGDSDGSISVQVNGGAPPYLLSLDGAPFSPVDQFSFLPAGSYEIVVQDVNGCESTAIQEVTQPAELQVELGGAETTIQLGTALDLDPQFTGSYDTLIWSTCPSDTIVMKPIQSYH